MLARTQTGWVVRQLESHWPGLAVEVVLISSSGDMILDRPLHEFGGKGLFTKELEIALLDGKIDVAVHSFKDVPVTMPLVDVEGRVITAVSAREDARDVLISRMARRVEDLPQGARVGTGSLRRQCQLLDKRGDLRICGLRGNIDTRIRKLCEGEYDAIVLAMAGVKRAGLWDEAMMTAIDTETMVPSAGQGALALECRTDDPGTRTVVAVMDDPATRRCVKVEREVVRALDGDCHSPIGAWARMVAGLMVIDAAVGATDGGLPVRRARGGSAAEVVRGLGR